MKRAHVIVTDADYVFVTEAWSTRTTQEVRVQPSEQLLADLRRVLARAVQRVEDCELIINEKLPEDWQAIARVRALLPEEGDDEGR